ncbi:MAG: ABC transporter permease [Acidobacteria bacterium]|nr:ABC transporter permease [Acidobacteriota bacterium]
MKTRPNWPLRTGIAIVAVLYFVPIFADFLAPYEHREQQRQTPSAPRSTIRFADENGNFAATPRVFGYRMADALTQRYEADETRSAPMLFFVKGYSYRLFGLFETDRHLFGTPIESPETPKAHLLGTDALGRDRFSRLVRATRFSLLVAPAGTILACLLGITIGMISGYSNRFVDSILMGITDAVLSLPSLIVILAARVAFPLELPPFTAAVLLIGIFALTGWSEMARLARGLVKETLAMDYILAAKATGVKPLRTMTHHVLPNITRPLLTQAMLILPAFLLAEAALSFLGVGLQEPEPSLGNMLSAAADIAQLKLQPLLLLSPALVIVAYVFGVRLIGNELKNDDR